MQLRQIFEKNSCTHTYLLTGSKDGEALIIDPVSKKIAHYLSLIYELDLKLVKAIDTHVYADHITALGALSDKTSCITVMDK
jgi:sulfur dioxygenase